MMNLVEARHLVKIYGDGLQNEKVTALHNFNITIQPGDFIAIMGPSGSGKTTLFNLLSGIDRTTSGEVLIEGMPIHEMSKEALAKFRRKKLGFVFQHFNLVHNLTVKENIMLPMILEKMDVATMEERVDKFTKLFDIHSILHKFPYAISGGQQQRVAIARALVNEPPLLFADEPTGNLDSKSANTVMQCFEHIVAELQTTILLVTHDVFAASYCQKIIFIKDGRIHSTLSKKGDRASFLQQIMDNLTMLGGSRDVF